MSKSEAKIKKVSLESLAILTRQMSFLFGTGISFSKILSILEEQTNDIKLRQVINELNKYIVSGGLSLSKAMSKFPGVFSPAYVGMIRAGEMSGNMPKLIEKLADNCEKEVALTKKIGSALVYPFFVCIVAVLSVVFILKYIFPLFMPLLLQSGKPLPLPTMILINFTRTISNPYFIFILVLIGIIIYWLFKEYLKSPVGRLWWGRSVFEFPVFGDILKKVELIRFCRILNMLYGSGSSFIFGMNALKDMVSNEYLKQELGGVINRVSDGGALGASFGKSGAFPSTFKSMVATIDESANFDKILPKIVTMYELDVETALNTAVALIEPFLIIFLGIVIGFILLSVFIPMYGVIGG